MRPLLFLLYINDFHNCSNFFDFHIFADDTNLFSSDRSLLNLESAINKTLPCIFNWLVANKLSLNIKKTNFIIFHPPQKKTQYSVKLFINGEGIKQVNTIKYLGIYIDSHLNWKAHVSYIAKKIKRCIGVLSKIRYFVNISVLIQLYYSMIFPFLSYGIITWGNTYQTTLNSLITIQKKAMRIMTFSDYKAHSSPLFFRLKILKFLDLIFIQNALLMHDFYNNKLPDAFSDLFMSISSVHQYNTRLASKKTYYLPRIRTNYGKFNIRFNGVKVWNSLSEDLKTKARTVFKRQLSDSLINDYAAS